MGWHQKGKTNLEFTEARDSEWQWHQLGHMQVCTSLQTDNHTSTPPLSFLQAGCPSCSPTNSIKALKAGTGTNKQKKMKEDILSTRQRLRQRCVLAECFLAISDSKLVLSHLSVVKGPECLLHRAVDGILVMSVHRVHMRFSDEVLGVRMLTGHLHPQPVVHQRQSSPSSTDTANNVSAADHRSYEAKIVVQGS